MCKCKECKVWTWLKSLFNSPCDCQKKACCDDGKCCEEKKEEVVEEEKK